MQKIVKNPKCALKGSITIPSDKSVSHRAVILCSLAEGKSVIKNFSNGQDPKSSLKICQELGVNCEFENNNLVINSRGILSKPQKELNCGNSGTTMRFMCGILVAQNFTSTLTGDESLSKRPMKRIIEPLTLMGADISSVDNKAPLVIKGRELHSINYKSQLASAQVKSCILLAGMHCSGTTTFEEPYISRNHTELMLKYMGCNIQIQNNAVKIQKSKLNPITIEIPGDISSAAFFIAAALIIPNSDIIIKNTGINPTRTGILDIAKKMGADIEILDERTVSNELVADLRVRYCDLKACTIEGEIIPKLIDELPVIAVLATQCKGQTIIKDAQDLRNKETDRIKAVVTELKKLGADIEETQDGFIINGKTELIGGCSVNTYHDHRLAMSLYVAGMICNQPVGIDGFEWVDISFPEFEKLICDLQQK